MMPAPFQHPWLCTLAGVFRQAGAPLYAVGGAVRNVLMGLPPSDMDVCGPTHPEAVVRLCQDTPVHAVLRAAHFGTVELHGSDSQGRHMAEYTTFRVDSYRGGHQPSSVRFAETVSVDALRRDFSVNALYWALNDGLEAPPPVLDPTGGLTHMRQGVLHTVTADPDQVLKDDGLRILRAARFQAELGFMPTDALLISARRFSPLLGDIAWERRRDELAKLLTADLRYPALPRTTPAVPAGLGTVYRVNAWQALFGSLGMDEGALSATAHYQAPEGIPPIAGKLALLFLQETPERLADRIAVLRFSRLDALAAHAALSASRALVTGNLTAMSALRLGMPALAHAVASFRALAAVGEPYGAALSAALALQATLQGNDIPKTLKALAVHGDDLAPILRAHGVAKRQTGALLDMLWQWVVSRAGANQRQALLAQAENFVKQMPRAL